MPQTTIKRLLRGNAEKGFEVLFELHRRDLCSLYHTLRKLFVTILFDEIYLIALSDVCKVNPYG